MSTLTYTYYWVKNTQNNNINSGNKKIKIKIFKINNAIKTVIYDRIALLLTLISVKMTNNIKNSLKENTTHLKKN